MTIPLKGDRGVFDVDNYATLHASDIWASLPVYHVVGGSATGDISVWDGFKWVPVALDTSLIFYTPAELSDWNGNTDPGNLDDAVDQLAGRTDDLEGLSHAAVTLHALTTRLLTLNGQEILLAAVASGGLVLAGNATGAEEPSFRLLADTDIPALHHSRFLSLNADDHTQYLLATGARIGATATGQQFEKGSWQGSNAHHSAFDDTGHLTMVGNARPWRDELGELLGKKRKGSRITEDLDEGTILFADTCQIADDWVITNVQLNHDKDLTSSIRPHLHWFQSSANIPNWLLYYRWQVNGAEKTTAWTPVKSTGQAFDYTGGTTLHQISVWAAITVPPGSTISDIVQFRITRDTDNDSGLFGTPGTDPLTGNASALMFDVHFQINSLGSTDEYMK